MFFATAGDDYFVAELVERFGEATANTRAPSGDKDGVVG
jgi:hypothetical protein